MSKIKYKEPQYQEAITQIISDYTVADGQQLRNVVVEDTEAYYSERYGWSLRRKELVQHQATQARGLFIGNICFETCLNNPFHAFCDQDHTSLLTERDSD